MLDESLLYWPCEMYHTPDTKWTTIVSSRRYNIIFILKLGDLLCYSFKPLYLFILQGLSRETVYRKIFKGLDWISFVQIKVWKNTSQIRGIKERSFYAIHNTMHFHSSILQQQAVFTSFVKSCLKVYYLLESAFVCFCILL